MTELPLRKFGITFGAVFAVLAAWLREAPLPLAAVSVLSVGMIATAFARPALLTVPARLWMRLGDLLHRVVSPLVLGIMYFGLFVPFGLARRWLGGDPLKRRYDAALASYWAQCPARSRKLDDFRQQF
jgi:hypothetical protein